MVIADHALGIHQKGFRRAVHAQVETKAAIRVKDVDLEGVAEFGQKLQAFLAGIPIVDAHHADTVIRQ